MPTRRHLSTFVPQSLVFSAICLFGVAMPAKTETQVVGTFMWRTEERPDSGCSSWPRPRARLEHGAIRARRRRGTIGGDPWRYGARLTCLVSPRTAWAPPSVPTSAANTLPCTSTATPSPDIPSGASVLCGGIR